MKSFALTVGFLIVLCTRGLIAQSPDIAWTKVIGGVDSEEGNSVQQTTDGGYIVAGQTRSYGAGWDDVYLIKTDSSGDTLWTKAIGGIYPDVGSSVQQTTDGGYIVTGTTLSYGPGYCNVYLIKTDSSGDTLWTRTFGDGSDVANSVRQTTDGGYIVTGYTGYSDVYLIKTDSSGDTLWTRTIGGTDSDAGNSVRQTTDSGYIVTGSTSSYGAGSEDVYLIKTDSSGDTLWTKTFGGVENERGYSVQLTTDGGYIVTGSTSSYGAGESDVYLIKTDSSGDTLWTKTFGGASYDAGQSIWQTSDLGYIVAGYTNVAGEYAVYLIKTDSSGNTLWTKTVGGASYSMSYSVQQTTDEGYIVTGVTVPYGSGNADVYLIKLQPETGIEEETEGKPLFSLESVGPNPFSSDLSITCSIPEQARVELAIFDLSGRLVEALISEQLPAGSHTVMWNPSQDIPNGCYLVVLDACGRREVARCLKLYCP